MSLHTRVSANTSRRPSVSHVQFIDPDYDYDSRLLDSLNEAHTQLNKTNSERDRYQNLYEQASIKITEANSTIAELKSQNQACKETIASSKEKISQLKEENDRLAFENSAIARDYAELRAKFNDLTHQFNTLSAVTSPTFSSSTSASAPERPKLSRSSSKRDRKEDRKEERQERNRNREKDDKKGRDKEKDKDKDKDKDKEKEKDADKDRDRERDREREREKKREEKEQRAEKERLSKRFEERRPPLANSNSASNRRNSFIEGWGPGGRSSSSGSSTRSYTNVPSGHTQKPDVPANHKGTYIGINIPRNGGNPMMTPRIYTSSGSSTPYEDDVAFEDGNYHAYPISR